MCLSNMCFSMHVAWKSNSFSLSLNTIWKPSNQCVSSGIVVVFQLCSAQSKCSCRWTNAGWGEESFLYLPQWFPGRSICSVPRDLITKTEKRTICRIILVRQQYKHIRTLKYKGISIIIYKTHTATTLLPLFSLNEQWSKKKHFNVSSVVQIF